MLIDGIRIIPPQYAACDGFDVRRGYAQQASRLQDTKKFLQHVEYMRFAKMLKRGNGNDFRDDAIMEWKLLTHIKYQIDPWKRNDIHIKKFIRFERIPASADIQLGSNKPLRLPFFRARGRLTPIMGVFCPAIQKTVRADIGIVLVDNALHPDYHIIAFMHSFSYVYHR